MTVKFVEKTKDEQGFSLLWDAYVMPHMDHYARHYYRYSWLAHGVLTLMTIIFFGGGAWLIEYGKTTDAGIAVNISALLLLGLCTLVGYLAYLPFKRLTAMSGQQLEVALERHFQHQFSPITEKKDLEEVADFLQDENMTSDGTAKIGAAYQSNGAIGRYRFFNCTYSTSSSENRTIVHYLILHMKLDVTLSEKIRIMPDRGMANAIVRLFTRRRNVRLSNATFEKRLEVYSKDAAATHKLLTPAVQQSFVDMQDYFSKGRSWLKGRCLVTCMLEGDEMILCLEGLDDITARELAGKAPRKIVHAAHAAIGRLAQIPLIVRNMQDVMPQIRR